MVGKVQIPPDPPQLLEDHGQRSQSWEPSSFLRSLSNEELVSDLVAEGLSSGTSRSRSLREGRVLVSEGLERLSIYGFSMDYPKNYHVEFNPKSKRDAGDVVFHFPDKEKIFLSWGDLEQATKSFKTVEEHAEHSLGKVKKSGNVKNFTRVLQGSLNINSHKSAYNVVRLNEMTVGLFTGKRTVPREAYSVHLHCPDSSRYFVIYAMLSASVAAEYEKILMTMANSLRCH